MQCECVTWVGLNTVCFMLDFLQILFNELNISVFTNILFPQECVSHGTVGIPMTLWGFPWHCGDSHGTVHGTVVHAVAMVILVICPAERRQV